MNSALIYNIVLAFMLQGTCLLAQEESKVDDSVLKQAQQLSAATGRPIFAVAGRST